MDRNCPIGRKLSEIRVKCLGSEVKISKFLENIYVFAETKNSMNRDPIFVMDTLCAGRGFKISRNQNPDLNYSLCENIKIF